MSTTRASYSQPNETLKPHQVLELSLITAIGAALNGEVFLCDCDGKVCDTICSSEIPLRERLTAIVSNIYDLPSAPKELIELALKGYPFTNFVINDQGVRGTSYCFSSRAFSATSDPVHNGVVVLIRPHHGTKESPLLIERTASFDSLLGSDLQFITSKKRAILFAPTEKRLFIQGESGTGKELLAKAIHNASRPYKPFVKINCASLTHKHAMRFLSGFMENKQLHPGVLSTVQGGTLFLDNIDKLRPNVQPFVMQILDENEIVPLSGSQPIKADFRLISASSADLISNLGDTDIRGDFFFRFAHESLIIPPLRERKGDILSLAYLYISKFCSKHGVRPLSLSPKANELLLTYNWPGNIRELESVIYQACRLCTEPTIQPEHILPHLVIPSDADQSSGTKHSFPTMRDQERYRIADAYENARHNVAEAANMLGMSKTTFYRRLKEYNLGKHS